MNPSYSNFMMKSSNGHIFRVTGTLCGEFTAQSRGALMFCLICTWTNGCANNRDVGDLRRRRTHYDATVMYREKSWHRTRIRYEKERVIKTNQFFIKNESSRQINALKRVSKYLGEAFISSNSNYSPVSWMFCGKRNLNELDQLHEGAIWFVFCDTNYPCAILLKRRNFFSLPCI